MTTRNKPSPNEVMPAVDLDKLQADMEMTVGSMSFPGTSRLVGERQKIGARRAELLAEKEQYLSRQQLVESQHATLMKAIGTNLADIEATLALYPETEVPGSNVTVLRQGAAE